MSTRDDDGSVNVPGNKTTNEEEEGRETTGGDDAAAAYSDDHIWTHGNSQQHHQSNTVKIPEKSMKIEKTANKWQKERGSCNRFVSCGHYTTRSSEEKECEGAVSGRIHQTIINSFVSHPNTKHGTQNAFFWETVSRSLLLGYAKYRRTFSK